MIDLAQKSTVTLINELEALSDAAKAGVFKDWKKNWSRLMGRHEEELNDIITRKAGYALRSGHAQNPRKVQAAILNVSHRRHLSYLSKQMQAMRRFQVVPTSNQRDDRLKSKGAERMLTNRMSEYGGPDTREHMLTLATLRCSDIAFELIEGDPTKARPYIAGKETKQAKGDVLLRAMTPYDVAWFPGVRMALDSPAVVIHERLTANEIERRWDIEVTDDFSAAKWHPQSPFGDLEGNIEEALYSVKRLFILPCRLYPNGAQRIVLGEEIVRKTVLAARRKEFKGKDAADVPREAEWIGTPDGRYPMVEFRAIPLSPNSIGNGGTMRAAGALQKALNLAWTKVIAILTETPGDILTRPPGPLSDDEIASQVGVLSVEMQDLGTQGIKYVGAPHLEHYMNVVTFAVKMLDDIFGAPATSRGQIPGSRTAGKTLQIAATLAAEVDAPEELAVRLGAVEAQKRILIEGREVWPESFLYNAIGHNHEWAQREFKKADIPAAVDVQIKRDDAMPQDRASRLRWATEMFKTGAWGNPADPKVRRRFLETVEFPTEDEGFAHEEVQLQLVRNEMEAMKTGPRPVNLEDDDELHETEHALALAEDLAQGKADMDYRRNVAAHLLLHDMNQKRKLEIEQMDMPSEVPEPELSLENLVEEQNRIIDLTAQLQEAQATAAAAQEVASAATEEAEDTVGALGDLSEMVQQPVGEGV